MREYTIHYRNGESKVHHCDDKSSLIKEIFEGDQTRFQREVTMLSWQMQGIHYTENVERGEIDGQLTSADANPYGWRK